VRPRADIIAELTRRGLLPEVLATCTAHGVTMSEVCDSRSKSASACRHAILHGIYRREDRHYSYPDIARMWGLDHTTVRSAVLNVDLRKCAAPSGPALNAARA
jgi:hypothetical protein